jgi:hypothetical protein
LSIRVTDDGVMENRCHKLKRIAFYLQLIV